jgi:hypothetical protein
MNIIIESKPIDIQVKPITDKQFKGACKSAGLAFICERIEYFLLNLQCFDDRLLKKEIIKEIYIKKGRDSKITATPTRVNGLLRIIRSGRIEEVLKKACNSKYIETKAVSKAKNLLKRINF